ncbi:TetR/AcrR family transcriptional regulator [Streptomyces kanasensis]|uniref:TetR/AcrR family transcriptional regulator n=1 Tax=Streptomyces kanasensis TaxID=936756 RepID=UPI0036F4B8D2
MPLPRFHRLPSDTQAALLAVARAHFARAGRDAASFNRIIAEAGISKTSAYHYFDGKEDLFDAVVGDAARRTLAALGPWTEVATAGELWAQLAEGASRLAEHLRTHPDDRAVLAAGRGLEHADDSWIHRLVDNGLRVGVIDPGPSAELLTMVTVAVFTAVDEWTLAHPDRADGGVTQALTAYLARLWQTPPPAGGAGVDPR